MIAKIFVAVDLEKRKELLNEQLILHSMKIDHPDVLYIDSEQKLGIEQSRSIKEFFSLRPYQSKGRAIVIEDLSGITVDAQNALLKVLEEPPEEAIILLGASNTNHLLPTFLSRCEIVQVDDSSGAKDFSKIVELLQQDTAGRFKVIEKTDDKVVLLQNLLLYIEQEFQKDSSKVSIARESLEMERWQKANVNVRGVLEYLMLVIPKV